MGDGVSEPAAAESAPRRRPATERREKEPPQSLRTCFVVAPIGRDASDIRRRSDQILRHIIDPVVQDLGYGPALRADRISESGRITQQVIQHITDDDLVIADLTGSNPNVYYELALRHALGKPFVQLLTGNDPLPFDIADQRTIMVDHQDLDSVAAAKEELRRQIVGLHELNGRPVETPLSFSVDLAALRSSDNPVEKTNAEMLEMLQSLVRNQRPRIVSRQQGPDVDALHKFVETVVVDGMVTDEDIAALITNTTSANHDEWVETVVEQKALPFLQPNRSSRPPSGGGYSEEPPF